MCVRSARKEQIEREIADYQRMNKQGLSMRQIAKRIGMSPSSHLMSILWELAEESRLIAKPLDYRPGMTAWNWKLPPDRLSRLSF